MTTLWSFSDKLLKHLRDPKNVGVIKNADGVGYVGDSAWGIDMELYIKVEDGIIADAKFKTFGCGAAIATSSMTTELAKGKTLEEAMKLSRKDVADNLGGLPAIKMHCSNLAADGLHAAIEDYLKKKGAKK